MYEIKVIKRSGRLSLQFTQSYYSDFTAIRAAKNLCLNDGDTVDVSRDGESIYSERPKPIRLVWPVCAKGA
jgi:hypothetical protein